MNKIFNLFKNRTGKNTLIIFSGNLISSILGFICITLISRTLGPEEFGLFSLFSSLTITIAGFTDFGLTTAFVNKYSSSTDLDMKKSLMHLLFKIEIGIGICILILGGLFYILRNTFGFAENYELTITTLLVVVCAAFISSSAYIIMILQAKQKFIALSVWNLFQALGKIIFIGIFLLIGSLTALNSIFIYTFISVIAFVVGVIYVRWEKEKRHDFPANKLLPDLFKYSKWIMLSFMITSLSGRLEIYALSFFKDSYNVGIYSAAFQIALIYSILLSSMNIVFLPRLSEMKTKAEYISFAKKVFKLSSILFLLSLPLFFVARDIIIIVFGYGYIDSVQIFQIILIGYLFSLFAGPISTFFYAWKKPFVLTILNLMQLVIAVSLNVILIPKYGPVGAAFAWLSSSMVGLIYLVILFIRNIQSFHTESNSS